MSKWQQTAVIGIAKLMGSAALSVPTGSSLVAATADLLKALFEGEDEARRSRAGEFAVQVAGVIKHAISEGIDERTVEAAWIEASNALRDYGLKDSEVVKLDLDPTRAACAVIANVTFSADERVEVAPLVKEVLVAFYLGVTRGPATFPEFMPAIQAELLRRGTRQDAKLDLILDAIAREKGVPIPPLLTILRKLGQAEVPPEQITARLEAAADRLRELEERLSRPSNDRPETVAARARARALIDEGNLDAAEIVLREARAAMQALRQQTSREEAALLTDQAGVAAARLAFSEAANLHREAARLVDFDPEAAWTAWMLGGDALYTLGRDFGDPKMLRQAVAWLYQECLPRVPRAERPLDWANTKNMLGNALWVLGQRGDDQALQAAVVSYREALTERSQDRVPLDWAATQNNLGSALLTLGERGDDQALQAAVAAYREALQVYTSDRSPLDWAKTQNNLGNALQRIGERGGDQPLREAIHAYREALRECTRDRVPLAWARTKNNLGSALMILGERGDYQALQDAVAAFHEALTERTQERVPLDWATTQNNLGNALATLGERGDDQALQNAVAAFRGALKENTRDRVPLSWAMTQNNLGNALLTLGKRGDDQALQDAVAAYREALKEYTRDRVPRQWALTQENLAMALTLQAARFRDCGLIREALAAIDGAIAEFSNPGAPYNRDKARRMRELVTRTARELGCS